MKKLKCIFSNLVGIPDIKEGSVVFEAEVKRIARVNNWTFDLASMPSPNKTYALTEKKCVLDKNPLVVYYPMVKAVFVEIETSNSYEDYSDLTSGQIEDIHKKIDEYRKQNAPFLKLMANESNYKIEKMKEFLQDLKDDIEDKFEIKLDETYKNFGII